MTANVDAEDVERLRIALVRIARLIDRQVSGQGLTRTQLSVLGAVAMRGPLGLSELADIEKINPTMLSRVVAKLEEADLIRRQVDPDDRRAARVEVTEAGAELRRRLNAERTRVLAERLAGMAPDTAAELVAALPALEALGQQLLLPAIDATSGVLTTASAGAPTQ
jgi:DNA-binding MarR family transcriptional regulator